MPMQKSVFAVGALVALGGAFANAAAPPRVQSQSFVQTFVEEQKGVDRPFEDSTWEFSGQHVFINANLDIGLSIPNPETSDVVVAESYAKASKDWGGSAYPIQKYSIQVYSRDDGKIDRIYLRNGVDGEFRRLAQNTTSSGEYCITMYGDKHCRPQFTLHGLVADAPLPEGFVDEFELRSFIDEDYNNHDTYKIRLQKEVGNTWHTMCIPDFVPVGDNMHFPIVMLESDKLGTDIGINRCSYTFARIMKTDNGINELFDEFFYGGTYILFNKKYNAPIKPFQFDDAAGILSNADQWGPSARFDVSVFNRNTWMIGFRTTHRATRTAYQHFGMHHDYLDVDDHTFKLGTSHNTKSKPDKIFEEPGAKLHVVISSADTHYWAFRNSYDSRYMMIREDLLNDQGTSEDASSWHIVKIVPNPIRLVAWSRDL